MIFRTDKHRHRTPAQRSMVRDHLIARAPEPSPMPWAERPWREHEIAIIRTGIAIGSARLAGEAARDLASACLAPRRSL